MNEVGSPRSYLKISIGILVTEGRTPLLINDSAINDFALSFCYGFSYPPSSVL